MSDDKFPLCKAARLTVIPSEYKPYGWTFVVDARDVEKMLEQAPVVHGERIPSTGEDIWCRPGATHILAVQKSARLVCVEPIKKDSVEDLLREMETAWADVIKRAKRLLGEE